MTGDTGHVTHDTWCGVNFSRDILTRANDSVGQIWRKRMSELMNEWMNQSVTEVIVEQPWLHKVY